MSSQESKAPEIVVRAVSDAYDENDGRWVDQVDEFHKDLRRDVGPVRQEVEAQEGRKGGFESIMVALGSADALIAAATMFKAWLSTDRSRSLELSYERGGETRKITVSGKGFSQDDIKAFLHDAWDKVSE